MTRDQIMSMTAQELAEATAVHVMRWTWKNGRDRLQGGTIWFDDWNPAEDISAAWELVEMFDTNTFNLNWLDSNSIYGEGWHCKLDDAHAYRCKTAPEAICKAALLAVMGI